ncbi:protein HEG homolog 1 [Stegostoma tigrinum]|uniref:protein HEG homolog 1 n=1 Tax=Stegostoma tigrinum TaxID=3053191 RepID=UPI00202BA384|nr:protein HEG homolog 1 [Stegostoma tigrinum]XP_048416771.1 protein HEG homolog 1 [Stegostoma tigrinum]
MALIHSVTLTCLLSLICYIAAQNDTSSTAATGETSPTELTPVMSSSSSSSNTAAEPQTTEHIFTSKPSTVDKSTTSAPISASEVTVVTAISAVSNTSLSASAPHISVTSAKSSSTDEETKPTEVQTSSSNATLDITHSPVNMTVPTSGVSTLQTVATTEMPTNTTVNTTQTSTPEHITNATIPHNASTSIPTTSGKINVTTPSVFSTTERSTWVPMNITSANTSANSEASTNATVPATATVSINATMPMNTTSVTMTQSTELSNSTWSTTQPPKTMTPQPADHCKNAVCPPSSTCVNLFQSYKCQCSPGLIEKENSCVPARIFPGILHLTNITFMDAMKETNTKAFSDTAKEIVKEMEGLFKDDSSFYKSVVRKLGKGSVIAFLDNIFALSSNATEKSVTTHIQEGIKTCTSCKLISPSDSFTGQSICSLNPCDNTTSQCNANNGIAICKCLPGYFKFDASDRSCKACLSGFKLENGTCVKCPFGYGGFNCDKPYLLAVVVISCVLGGILLLLLLALIATCLRSKSGSCSSSSGSHDYVMWPKSEMPKIPRATMHWDGNQLEMQENGSTSSLNDIHRDAGRAPDKNDDLKTFKGKQQSRYTYLCQGQENPYYVSDEKKPEYL